MNAKEIERLHWMRLLSEARTTQRKAAEALGLIPRVLSRRTRGFVIVDNKVLAAALTDIQRQQHEREARTLATKRMTLREEDLYREALGETLPAERSRRGTRPTIREVALTQQAAAVENSSLSSPNVDRMLAQTLERLGGLSPAVAPRA